MLRKAAIKKIEGIIQSYIPKNHTCASDESKRQYLRTKDKITILAAIKQKTDTMGNIIEVSVGANWEKQDPDMSVCKACKEVVYGPQYELLFMVCGERVEQTHPVKLCEPCYLKKDDS